MSETKLAPRIGFIGIGNMGLPKCTTCWKRDRVPCSPRFGRR